MSDLTGRKIILNAKPKPIREALAFARALVRKELEDACHSPATREYAVECQATILTIKRILEESEKIMCEQITPSQMSDEAIRAERETIESRDSALRAEQDRRYLRQKARAELPIWQEAQAGYEAKRQAFRDQQEQHYAAQEAEQATAATRRQERREGTPQERTRARIKAETGLTV